MAPPGPGRERTKEPRPPSGRRIPVLVVLLALVAGAWGPGSSVGIEPSEVLAGVPCDLAVVGPGVVCERWSTQFHPALVPAAHDAKARAHALSPSGDRVFVTGGTNQLDAPQDATTVAIDTATGAVLWHASYDGPDGLDDVAITVAVGPDGSDVYAGGYSTGDSTGRDLFVIKYEFGTSDPEWVFRYDGPVSSVDVAHTVRVAPDGDTVFVAGTHTIGFNDRELIVFALDAATGSKQWSAQMGGSGHRAVVSPDGAHLFVGGSPDKSDLRVVAFETATGDVAWSSTYDGPAHSTDFMKALAVTPDGTKIIAGGLTAAHGWDGIVVGFDAATGAVLWDAWYSDPEAALTQNIQDLVISEDSSTVYAGGVASARSVGIQGGHNQQLVMAIDAADGSFKWVRETLSRGLIGPGTVGIAIGPDGDHVYAVAIETGVGVPSLANRLPIAADILTTSYDAVTGELEWGARYAGYAGHALPVGISTLPHNSDVLVVGTASNAAEWDSYVVIAYHGEQFGHVVPDGG